MKHPTFGLVLASLALAAASFTANAADRVFSNPAPIAVPGTGSFGPANPHPSNISVTGLSGNVDNVRVSLNNMSHTFPDDIDIILQAPNGQQMLLMSDTGSRFDLVGVTLNFSASAGGGLPNDTQIVSGIYLPTNFNTVGNLEAISNTDLAVFNGPAANANGNWSLYAVDDEAVDIGSIAGGWTLTIAEAQSCASEGYTSTKLEWCKNICERGLTGATLDIWIHRWITRYRDLPYCAVAAPPPPQS